jgi:hypothetical protein
LRSSEAILSPLKGLGFSVGIEPTAYAVGYTFCCPLRGLELERCAVSGQWIQSTGSLHSGLKALGRDDKGFVL